MEIENEFVDYLGIWTVKVTEQNFDWQNDLHRSLFCAKQQICGGLSVQPDKPTQMIVRLPPAKAQAIFELFGVEFDDWHGR